MAAKVTSPAPTAHWPRVSRSPPAAIAASAITAIAVHTSGITHETKKPIGVANAISAAAMR